VHVGTKLQLEQTQRNLKFHTDSLKNREETENKIETAKTSLNGLFRHRGFGSMDFAILRGARFTTRAWHESPATFKVRGPSKCEVEVRSEYKANMGTDVQINQRIISAM
jgi:hypothetical protein